MRKYFIAILAIAFLSGCEKDFDQVIDVLYDTYQVSFVGGIKDTIDLKNPADSLMEPRLGFRSGSEPDKVYFSVYASDNSLLSPLPVEMNPITNNIYSNQFVLKRSYPIGNYNIKFYVEDKNAGNKLVALKSFYFNNGQDNVAPLVSDLDAPDTVEIGTDTTFILINLTASDANGLNDIELVFFNSYIPPNGNPSSQNPIRLYDNGTNGDQAAGDGRFSRIVILPPTGVTLGIYRWEFQARDRSGELSNKIVHNIVVQ